MTTEPEPTFDEVPAEPVGLPHEPAVRRSVESIGREIGEVMDASGALDASVTDGGSIGQIRRYWAERLRLAGAEKLLWIEMRDAMHDRGTYSIWQIGAANASIALAAQEEAEAVAMVNRYARHGGPGGWL